MYFRRDISQYMNEQFFATKANIIFAVISSMSEITRTKSFRTLMNFAKTVSTIKYKFEKI